jgi:Zn-dependent M28 family amino/carboxypeptidase
MSHICMSHWLAETLTSDAGPSLHEELVDIGNRLAGSDGERAGAEAVRDALDAAGAQDARLSEYDIQGWTRESNQITAGEESFEGFALPRGPAGEVTGELIDLGYGRPEDFETADIEDKVVVVDTDVPEYYGRFIHRREKYYYAVEGGAAAFLFRNHVPGQLPPTGSVGSEANPIGEIPAVGVSKEDGGRLARRFEGEDVTVRVDCDVHDATSQNVHATLGPDTEEEVLVTSHVDSHDIAEGALDNGAGTAVLVQTAVALAAREDDLETKIRFVAFGSEEVGLVGSTHLADRMDLDSVKAVLNNDGSGRERDLRMVTNWFDELGEAGGRTAERLDAPVHTASRLSAHSDHWPFVQRGVPGVQMRSVTGNTGRGWGHTEADTYDKVDTRDIRNHAMLVADIAVDVAREAFDVAHKPPQDIAQALEAENKAEGMKIIGDWPF